MQKKILSLILTLCMLLGMFPFVVGTSAADSTAAYTEIGTADELIALMSDSSGWAGNYRLTDHIDLTGKNGQACIGNDTVPFTGIFDGNGKTVSGISLNITGRKGVGFFGIVRDAEIRDLTAKGSVTSNTNFTGGLIGAVTGNALVENCTSEITVTAPSRVGGIVGGIVLNNGLGTAEGTQLDLAAGAEVIIRGCTNAGTVTGSGTTAGNGRIGGVVGSASTGKTSGRHYTIENCANTGDVTGFEAVGGVLGFTDHASKNGGTIVGCSNSGTITGASSKATFVGGIVGKTLIGAGSTMEITACFNGGLVTGPAQIGGIVGYAQQVGTTISKCWNDGEVKGTGTYKDGADAGGIVGITNPAIVENCINTGAVDGKANKNVGGIVGRNAGTNTIRYNYNGGTTTSTGTSNIRAIIGGLGSSAGTLTPNYYSVGGTDSKGTLIEAADLANADAYPALDSELWLATTNGPELRVFHTHTDADSDGKCDTCGFNMGCKHESTRQETVTASTCATAGTANVYCTVCGDFIGTAALPLDPNNHERVVSVALQDGKAVYTCVCGVTYAETTEALDTVYVAASGVTALPAETAGTEANPFGSFELAMHYAAAVASANGSAAVVVKDSATVPASYSTPAFTGTVTVTGGSLILGGASTFKMNGAMTFRDISFDVDNPGSGAYLYAQNHKLVMDTGIQMVNAKTISLVINQEDRMSVNAVKMYVLGGFESIGTQSYTLDTDVTVRSGDYWFIGGGNRCVSGTMTVKGSTKLTLGLTDVADTLQTAWLNSFAVGSEHLSADTKATVIVDGEVTVGCYNVINQNGGGQEFLRTTDLVLRGDLNPLGSPVFDVTGSTAVTNGVINVYVDERVDTAIADADIFYGDSADATIAVIGYTVNKATYATYCVNHLNGHVDANSDGSCDICGGSMVCEHPDGMLEYRVTVPATCSTLGTEEVWCKSCGKKVRTQDLNYDAERHTGYRFVRNDRGLYNYICADCDANGNTPFSTDIEIPTIYVDNASTTNSQAIGDDFNIGTDAGKPVLTIEEAARRLSQSGGKIVLLDRYAIKEDITLPAYEKEITITTAKDITGFDTGFVTQKHGAVLSLGGPTKFETLIFNNGSSVQNNSDGGYYNTLVIVGNWNDVTFGEKLTTFGNCYFVTGKQFPTEDDTAAKTVKLSFAKTTAVKVNDKQAAVTFFGQLFLGSRGNADVKVANKTVTADFVGGTTVINLYAASTSSAAQNLRMENCNVTVNFYENAYIGTIRTGDGNTAGTGTAYLDSLTVNLNDSARVWSAFVPRNVRSLNIHVSGSADGRTLAQPVNLGECALTAGYLASDNYTGNETLTATYSSHSFAVGKTLTHSGYAADKVTIHVTDECVWDDGVITTPATPDAAGVKTYTCTVCGRTRTESVPFVCTTHSYIAKADGSYACAVCGETFTALPNAELILKVDSATVADGKVVVNVSMKTESFWGVRFAITAPEGFTLTSVESLLPTAGEGDDGTGTGLSLMSGTESIAVLGFKQPPVNYAVDQVVATLTYTVADTVDLTKALVFEATIKEAIKYEDNANVMMNALAVGIETTPSAHEHEYVGTITTPATCGKDGVKTFTCQGCGDSYTEAIPATGAHTFGEWIVTTPAQVGVKGEETRTCPVCGTTETREIPALEPEVYVAHIGNVGYTTVQAAFDAAKALETITVAEGTTETVAPKTTVYLAGDYSGITISGDYMLETTGRYKLVGGSVAADANIKFNYSAKAIVMPVTAPSGNPKGGQALNLGASVEYVYAPKKTHVDSFAEFFVKYELLGLDGKSVEEGSTDSEAVTLVIADRKDMAGDAARYAYILDGVPAKCMNNTIRITTYGVNADGSVTVGTKDWGAYVYLQTSLASATGTWRELVAALINYGALAQQNFAYNTANMLSDLLPEAERKLTVADYADVVIEKKYERETRTDANDQFEAFASSLELLDRINILVTVKSKAGASTEYAGVKAIYSYADAVTGETITGAIPFEEWTVGVVDAKGRTAYYISLNDVAARNLRALISLDIVNADGTSVYALQNLTFNAAENYCSTAKTGSNANLAAICCGIMNYCDKAIAYFGK